MSKRILSMLLALVMALSLAVPAFAADEFEAEAPAIQEEAPAAPVAEEPEAPAEAPDMPAVAAVEPDVPAVAAEEPDDAADDAPGAGDTATYDGKLVIEGDETQIVRIIQIDSADWTYLGDPREVGVAPGAQINFVLEPGYAIEESEDGGYDWDWDDDVYPATDDDILPIRVCVMYVPEEGGDLTVTIVEEDPSARPEIVPVTYSDDDARFGCAYDAYVGEDCYNYVFVKPGYTVTVDGGTLYGIFPSIDGTCLMAEYTVDEGSEGVTIDFVKSTGTFKIEAPEGAVLWADIYDDPNPETWGDTASYMGDLLLVPDIFPGMGIDLVLSAEYEIEGLDEALLMNTGIGTFTDPNDEKYGDSFRFYNIKTPETGNIELTVKEAKKLTVNYVGDVDGLVEGEYDETTFPGAEFSFTLKRGYYASFENAGFNWNSVIPEEELFVNHCGVDPEAESVTVTVTKAPGVLRFTEGRDEFMWGIGMDGEDGGYTSPIGGMKPGAHVWVALDGNAMLEFPDGEEPEGLNDYYSVISDPWNDHDGEIQHWYDFTAPDHDLEIHAVEGGEIPDAITVQFEGELDAIHYDTDQVYPGSSLTLRVQPGYYLETTFSNPDFWGEVDERGSNVFNLNVWPEAEEVTVTVGKASGKLIVDDPDHFVCWTNANGDETTSFSDPTLGMKPGARVDVALAGNATLEFQGGEPEDLGENYEYWDYDPNSEWYGQLIHHIGFTAPEEGDVIAKAVEGGEMPEPITVQFEGEVDAVHYDSDQVYPDGNLVIHVKPGYYLETTNSDPNFDGEFDEDGCKVIHLYAWPDAESVTVTVGEASGFLNIDDPDGHVWWTNANDDEDCRFTEPTLGMKPGTYINVALDGSAALEFLDGEEPENLGERYEVWLNNPDDVEHYGKTVHYYDFIAPEEGDVNAMVVEGEAPTALTVQFEGEVDAVHADGDQVYPGGHLSLHLQPGYYLQTTDSDTGFGGWTDDKGNYMIDLNVWPDAENVTVTVGKTTGELVIDGGPVVNLWMDSSDGSTRMSDPALGLAPNAEVGVTVPEGYAVQFWGVSDVSGPYEWVSDDPNSPFYGETLYDYICLTPLEGDVTAQILPVVSEATLTIEDEADAVIPNDAQDVKDAIGMVDDADRYLLSDGDVLEDGMGFILVKGGYAVNAVSGAIVIPDFSWISDYGPMAVYNGFFVTATDENPVVAVEKSEDVGRVITANVVNEDEADFQFANWSEEQEDGTYKLVAYGSVGIIVEDGYELDVDGAAYADTVVDETTGELMRIFELDVGAESITVTVTPVDKTELELTIAIVEAMAEFKDDYTAESWAAVEEALETAKVVAAKASATQAEVDDALDALDAAVNALVEAIPPAPASGTGWAYDESTGDYYFYKNNKLVANYWVGKVDGASKWDGNWYYVDADGKLLTGMWYIDDLHGGAGWYFLQPTNNNGEIGKMMTGWQWVGEQGGINYGTCYFSSKNGESGKCTYSTELGNWNGATWMK